MQSLNTVWKNSRLSGSRNGSLDPSKTNTTQWGISFSPLSQKNLRETHHSLDKKEEERRRAPSLYMPRREYSWMDRSSESYSCNKRQICQYVWVKHFKGFNFCGWAIFTTALNFADVQDHALYALYNHTYFTDFIFAISQDPSIFCYSNFIISLPTPTKYPIAYIHMI